MAQRTWCILKSALLATAMSAASALSLPAAAEPVTVKQLKAHTHVHGLAVDRKKPGKLLIATHHGLFRSGPDGQAELISPVQDFMGFTPDPSGPDRLYASGHPAGGGNLGFIASADNGATWTQVSPGVDGPVDFHQLTVSPADPAVVYGAYGALQTSRDAGKTWSAVGPLPDRLIDLAASAKDPDTLYAASEGGLSVSRDGGKSWEPVLEGVPVSLAEIAPDGSLYAFVLGRGLVRASEADLEFTTVAADWGDKVLLHMAVDPQDSRRMFAASTDGEIFASSDGGSTWSDFGE